MANRRAPAKKLPVSEKSEGDFDFPLSQSEEQQVQDNSYRSLQPDDGGYPAAICSICAQAALEKEQARKEKKFLEVASKQLNDEMIASAKVVQDAQKDLEGIYKRFLLEYAAIEDKIYKKWQYIQHEEEKLMKLLEQREKEDQAQLKKSSEVQLTGLSKMSAACRGGFSVLLTRSATYYGDKPCLRILASRTTIDHLLSHGSAMANRNI